MRQNAANWLDLAAKVWHFRRDVLAPKDAEDLAGRQGSLRQMLRERADAGKLKLGIESLEGALRRTGGAIYPKTSLTENVEFFLVAAIIILGIRTYFVQPFKIPTNSMWPTYYGMTAEYLPPEAPAPGFLTRAFRFAAFGAQRREAIAPRSGAVSAPFFRNRRMAYTLRSARSWLIFPAQVKEYTFLVDGEPTSVRVPQDFNEFDSIVVRTFFGTQAAFDAYWDRLYRSGQLAEQVVRLDESGNNFVQAVTVPLPKTVQAGEPVVRFDLLTGDQLFVDRVSYHFTQPKVGQGFVFRTGHIAGIDQDQYYIKRLVGVPGDVLEIKSPYLYRNGRPIAGAEAFDLNAKQVSPYGGYTYGDTLYGAHYLFKGQTLQVPPNFFFAMGDNSANSSDGRVWGFVPAKDVVGRPLFIYYPFTRRWGPAR